MAPGTKLFRSFRLLGAIAALLTAGVAAGERVKDLAGVAGVRSNQLVGYGIVVGLDGTGDQTTQTPFTVQSIVNMLADFGTIVPPGTSMQLRNVAAVTVHAELPSFAKPGQTIDVTVSSIGNARSLRGGSLLLAPLRGINGEIYAVAQGNLVVGGFGAEGADGSSVSVNVQSTGRIPNGATVEATVPNQLNSGDSVVLNLHNADFTTANRLSMAINSELGAGTATTLDSVSIEVLAPRDSTQRIAFLSHLENLEIAPGTPPARVIVNSRTGTVVIGTDVQVTAAAVAHGSLIVTISEQIGVSQPIAPFSNAGQTAVVPSSEISIEQEDSTMFMFGPATSLEDIVEAVNRVGAAPGDLVAILEALKQAGALRAELVVI